MTAATLAIPTISENRKAVIAGTIGNVLEWYDFGVYGYFATTMSAAAVANTPAARCRFE